MPRFFVSHDAVCEADGKILIDGENAHHISRSLRMAVGDKITLCDPGVCEYDCVLDAFTDNTVSARIMEKKPLTTEPPFRVCIYQALPKGDKLDTIIQKSVECGASAIRTFESEFCIAKEKPDAEQRKLERRRKIAVEAAKQSGRGMIPEVLPTVSFKEAIELASKADIPIFCYEGEGTESLKHNLQNIKEKLSADVCPEIAVVIGSEGGFSESEAAYAAEHNMFMTGLGSRILRAETVAGFVLGCLVYQFEM